MEELYVCVKDYQDTNFKLDEVKSVKEWQEEFIIEADLSNLESLAEELRNYTEPKDIINEIMETWQIELVPYESNTTYEWCNVCGQTTKILSTGGKCEHCGKFLLPCSLCDMNKVNCKKCKFNNKEE